VFKSKGIFAIGIMVTKIKSKKAWIRIVEAFFAILLILTVVITIQTNNLRRNDYTREIYEIQTNILNIISNDLSLRRLVLDENASEISSWIDSRGKIPNSFEYQVKICDLTEICNPDTYMNEMYVSERVISSTLEEYNPKIVKLFMWRKDN
jgi:hypothetical protein